MVNPAFESRFGGVREVGVTLTLTGGFTGILGWWVTLTHGKLWSGGVPRGLYPLTAALPAVQGRR